VEVVGLEAAKLGVAVLLVGLFSIAEDGSSVTLLIHVTAAGVARRADVSVVAWRHR